MNSLPLCGNTFRMRTAQNRMDAVKSALERLRGEHVVMQINRGRNKFERTEGVLKDLYPAIFFFGYMLH